MVKVVRGCYTQVHMLMVDGKMNCRIVHVNFRRLTAEATVLRPVRCRADIFCGRRGDNIACATTLPRALVPLHMSVYTQFI